MYRILNNQGASSLKESFTRISALEINYNLRNSSTDLVLPHPKREFLKNSFKFSGAKLWNSLPLQAKLAQSEYTGEHKMLAPRHVTKIKRSCKLPRDKISVQQYT